jgi:hypothetical protein
MAMILTRSNLALKRFSKRWESCETPHPAQLQDQAGCAQWRKLAEWKPNPFTSATFADINPPCVQLHESRF